MTSARPAARAKTRSPEAWRWLRVPAGPKAHSVFTRCTYRTVKLAQRADWSQPYSRGLAGPRARAANPRAWSCARAIVSRFYARILELTRWPGRMPLDGHSATLRVLAHDGAGSTFGLPMRSNASARGHGFVHGQRTLPAFGRVRWHGTSLQCHAQGLSHGRFRFSFARCRRRVVSTQPNCAISRAGSRPPETDV